MYRAVQAGQCCTDAASFKMRMSGIARFQQDIIGEVEDVKLAVIGGRL